MNHTKNRYRYIFPLVVFMIGLAAGYFLSTRSANSLIEKAHLKAKKTDSINTVKMDSIEKLKTMALDSVSVLDSTIITKNEELRLERLKRIPQAKIREYEAFILEKGVELYGSGHEDNSDRALIASYGVNGLEEVEVSRKIIKEQKVIIVYQGEIFRLENEIRVDYQKGLELAAKKCKPGQFKKGLFVGGGAASILLLLLLL